MIAAMEKDGEASKNVRWMVIGGFLESAIISLFLLTFYFCDIDAENI
jgi:hypothetical protein